jgi:cytochrome P450 PksS
MGAMTVRVDFASEAFLRDPAAAVAALRATAPVVRSRFPIVGPVWVTTTFEAAAQVLKDAKTFTLRKEGGRPVGLRWWMPRSVVALTSNMLAQDEPDHTRLRSIVDEAFRRRAVLGMEPDIRAIADRLADELFAQGEPADLVARYARLVPLSVICELLGLPQADRPQFIAWANAMGRLSGVLDLLRVSLGLKKMQRYFEARLSEARERGGEGLIAELVRVEREGGRITSDELVAMLFLLLIAGSETTTHLISGSVFELLKDPSKRDWLMQDWSRAGLAIEEFLRFVAPVQFSKPRYIRHDVEIEGVSLKRGDQVMAMLVAANLDPDANEHADQFDLARHPNRHLSFGTGIHFCLGHQLARLEAGCALEALFTRWPKLQLGIAPSGIRWRKRPGLRALARLPVAAS